MRKPHGLFSFLIAGLITPFVLAGTAQATRSVAVVLPSFQQKSHARAEQVAPLITEAIAALERGDEAAAKATLQRALAIEPDNVTAHTYLGVMADRAGDLTEAEKNFAAAAIAAPLSPSARNNHGAILLRLGRTAQAAKQFETSLRLDPKQPSALVNLAQIRFSSNTPEGLRAALDLFARAQALTPDVEIARALVVINLRLGEKGGVEIYYKDYLGLVEANPTANVASTPARAILGLALFEGGFIEPAIKELEAVYQAEPSNEKIIIALGRAYLRHGEIPLAGRTLELAVAHGLDSAPLYNALAEVYEKSGHVENAIPAMRLAIERDPQSESYRYTYGILLTNALAPAAAVIRLDEALKMFPDSARLWFALGIAHFKQSKNNEAAKALSRSIELDAKFAPAYAYLGMTFVELGNYPEALKLYNHALAIDPKLAVVDYMAADALLRQNDADLAQVEMHLMRAVKADATFAPVHLALGKLWLLNNRLNDALAELERAVALDADMTEAYYQLGRVYGRLNRKTDAQHTLATFKRLSETKKEEAEKQRREIVRRLSNVLY